jgi:NADPH2:quinone reductase
MQAVVTTRFGDPDVFEVMDLPDPTPGPGQLSIDVSHAAVGLVDVYLRQGRFRDSPSLPQPPYTPGLEVAGTVRELGAGVTSFRVGEPVVTLSGAGPLTGAGGYASITIADALLTASLEGSSVDPALAVSALPNAATAYLALTRIAHLEEGESVLVHGALGGLASAFPGMARELGASRVVGTVRASAMSAALASELPYDRVVPTEDFPTAIGDERFDVVIDPVGGQLRTATLEVTAPHGRILLVGNASNDWDNTVDTNTLWHRNIAMLGFSIGFYLPTHRELGRPAAEAALTAIEHGLINIPVDELPLEQAAAAHRRFESQSVPGRMVLRP